jgi:hypothetical protein
MFESDFRKEIFEALKYIYWKQNGINLPVYGVNDKLKDYATTKKDISNGYEVKQKEENRVTDEDKYEEGPNSKSTAATSQGSSSNFSYNDEINQWNNEVQQSVSTHMYSRN